MELKNRVVQLVGARRGWALRGGRQRRAAARVREDVGKSASMSFPVLRAARGEKRTSGQRPWGGAAGRFGRVDSRSVVSSANNSTRCTSTGGLILGDK